MAACDDASDDPTGERARGWPRDRPGARERHDRARCERCTRYVRAGAPDFDFDFRWCRDCKRAVWEGRAVTEPEVAALEAAIDSWESRHKVGGGLGHLRGRELRTAELLRLSLRKLK